MAEQLYINDKDAWTEWGIGLTQGSLSTLMTPEPMKDLIVNKSRIEHGERVIKAKTEYMDARDMSLGFYIVAKDWQTFRTKFNAFKTYITTTRKLEIRTKYEPDKYYKCWYLSCTQYQHLIQGIAKFTLKVREVNPNDRTKTTESGEES